MKICTKILFSFLMMVSLPSWAAYIEWIPTNKPNCQAYVGMEIESNRDVSGSWFGLCKGGYVTGKGDLAVFVAGNPTDISLSGTFKDGKLSGEGIKITADSQETGNYVAGNLNGAGTLFVRGGDFYNGNFVNGKQTGKGKKIWQGGDRYEGNFSNGEPDWTNEEKNIQANCQKLYEQKQYAEALNVCKQAANTADAISEANLGAMYDHGWGVGINYSESYKWARYSASHGYARGQHNLGQMFALGRGVTKNLNEALVWLRQSADQGYTYAQCAASAILSAEALGTRVGAGAAWTGEEAFNRTKRCVDATGDATSEAVLGLLYKKGIGVPRNMELARYWWEKSAAQGNQYAPGLLRGEE